jgi:hypothetical protein
MHFPMNIADFNEATICITRPIGGRRDDEGHTVRIEIQDKTSRQKIISIEVPMLEFAEALLGLAYRPCEYQIPSDPNLWGMIKEHKTISYSPCDSYSKDEIRAYLTDIVKPDEVDGWKASIEHSLGSQRPYNVQFVRFIANEPPQETEQHVPSL